MKVKMKWFYSGICLIFFEITAHAEGVSIGDPKTDLGELKIYGSISAKYEAKDYSKDDNKIIFDALKVKMAYTSPQIFGYFEAGCYQYDKLCDFSSLIDSYVGVNLNSTDKIKAGMQVVPFGPARFWESNNYGGIVTQVGLEDVHNIGLNYTKQLFENTTLDLAYFARDGGSFRGKSTDSARYSVNFVKPDESSEIQTHLEEKNMWVGRVIQNIDTGYEHVSANIGGSYWYSDIDNKESHQTGKRNAWALFGDVSYGDLKLGLIGGKSKVTNKDVNNPDVSVSGSWDYYNYLANDGKFYTLDLSYSFNDVKNIGTIMPYMMLSGYDKDKNGFKTSTRDIYGVSVFHKKMMFSAEYMLGKNDLLIGGTEYSLAEGDDNKTNRYFRLIATYYF